MMKQISDFGPNGLPVIEGVVFKIIIRFPFHCFGSDGSVWSKADPTGQGVMRKIWSKMNPALDVHGYRIVQMKSSDEHKRKLRKVHRLILEAFHGEPPSKTSVACHGNGIRSDNRSCNLRWGTPKENSLDRKKHGTEMIGEDNPIAKLTESQVIEIRERKAKGESYASIAKLFGIASSCVWAIYKRKTWAYLK